MKENVEMLLSEEQMKTVEEIIEFVRTLNEEETKKLRLLMQGARIMSVIEEQKNKGLYTRDQPEYKPLG